MVETAELEKLVAELKKVHSPFGRVRLLAGAWQSVRGLSPKQKRVLASQIGFRNAEALLDRVGKSGGNISSSLLRRVIRTARDLDREEFRRVKADLRDPEKRDEALRQALDLAERHLGESTGGEERAAEEAPPSTPDESPEPVPMAAEEAEPKPKEEPPPAVTPVPKRPPVVKVAEPPKIPPRGGPPASPSSAGEVPTVARPLPRTPPAPVPVARPTPAPRRQPPPAPAERRPASDDLLGRLEAEPRLIRRLTRLREELPKVGRLDREKLERLLDLFPRGWAQRRVVSSLFRAGLPQRLEAATALIERLESPAARRWCARDLLASRELTRSQRRSLADTYLARRTP